MKFMTLGMGVLSAAMIFTTIAPVHAATKTMYLVDHYKGDRSNFPDEKITYNKNGLIATIKETGDEGTDAAYNVSYVQNLTYKNNRIIKSFIKATENVTKVATPTYKGSKLNKLTYIYKGYGVTTKGTVTYKYKGRNIVKRTEISKDSDSKKAEKEVEKNTYKNGLLVKSGYFTFKYDAKGNIIYKYPVYIGDDSASITLKNKYSNGLLKSSTAVKYNNYDSENKTPVLTVTYKKVRVNASLAKKVKAQQAWILRGIGDDSIYNC